MSIPQLVATDLDGTVVRRDGSISERTIEAFRRVEASGAVLVIVTGRPPRWMREIAETVRHQGMAICANGALVYDLHSEEIVESNPIDPDVLADVVPRLRAALPELIFSVEHEGGFAHEAGWRRRGRDSTAVAGLQVGLKTLVSRPATKLLAFHPQLDADDLLAKVSEIAGGGVTPTHSSRHGLVEMSAAGVTKASTLARLAASHGIGPDRAVAFGDMPNDLPMLTWAGTAWAVANAHPRVLAAVDHVTADVNDDGVAQILEKIYR